MNLEKDEDAPGGWSFESQMKVLAWADEGDRDPDAEVAWVGPQPLADSATSLQGAVI